MSIFNDVDYRVRVMSFESGQYGMRELAAHLLVFTAQASAEFYSDPRAIAAGSMLEPHEHRFDRAGIVVDPDATSPWQALTAQEADAWLRDAEDRQIVIASLREELVGEYHGHYRKPSGPRMPDRR